MKNLRIFSIISIIIYLVMVVLMGDAIRCISPAVSVAVIIFFAYDRVLWRINPFEKTPKLRKRYKACQVSTYKGGYKYETEIVIRQSLSSIAVVENMGSSYCESVSSEFVKSNTGEWVLYYTYLTHPEMRMGDETDDMHYGTVILRYINRDHLVGEYFTNRKIQTAGRMELKSNTEK